MSTIINSTCGKCLECGDDVVVETAEGSVLGSHVKTCYGPEFVMFAGIPYAKPPVGKLRFLPPVPVSKWDGTFDAKKVREPAWSFLDFEDEVCGTEDCLYVKVSTPNVHPSTPMPVMVWIGSWAFYFDDMNLFGPGWLIQENVIVVQVSFRVGPFGFLSIKEIEAPGNCGLKDVVMALRWVRRNVQYFGGDPNNVTLFGSSSGASIIHYMMLSPMANGLYHKVILQSGTAINHWALDYHPIECVKKLAQELNINTDDMVEVVEKLRLLPDREIMEAFKQIKICRNKKHAFPTMFRPCVEVEYEGQPAFLTHYPTYLLKKGKYNRVPMMIGSNKHESKSFFYCMNTPMQGVYDKLNLDLSTLVPLELGLQESSPGSRSVGQRLLQFYTKGEKITEENAENFFDILTDYYFNYYVNKCVKIHATLAQEQSIYYYIWDAVIDWHTPTGLEIMKESSSQGIETLFLFQFMGCVLQGDRGGKAERMRQKIVKLWTNFVKYSDPTPDDDDRLLHVRWDPVTDPKRLNYLCISPDLTKGCNPFYERMCFWDSIMDDTNLSRTAAFFDAEVLSDETRINWVPPRTKSSFSLR